MAPFLEMKGITKVYPGVVANSKVNLSVERREIHALIGENGAGKSTLVNMLFGIDEPDEGEILLDGKPVRIASPLAAIRHGIGMGHQHFMLAEGLTVAENIILGEEPAKAGIISFKEARKKVADAALLYQFKLDPDKRVENLSVGAKQKVEILKALIRGSKLLILDEPTAVLTPQETEELFNQLSILKSQGFTIIFISHKLDEIKKICDRGTVMRQGKVTGAFNVAEVSIEEISRLMIGRVVTSESLKRPKTAAGAAVLEARGLGLALSKGKPLLENVSFKARAGRILGIAGVEGNGQDELVQVITGFQKGYSGRVSICGQDIRKLSVEELRKLGLSHIPEDRMLYGVAKDASIQDNIISTSYSGKSLSGRILQKRKAIEELSSGLARDFSIAARSVKERIGNLSGGNIQKVVVARELRSNPRLLVANQPTRGVDMGAAMAIRQKLLDMKEMGAAIVLLSADMSELLSLSDSCVVMYGGRIKAFFGKMDEADEETLGRYMLGVRSMSEDELERVMRDEEQAWAL